MPITQRLVRVETKKLDVDKLNPADALDRIAINTMVGLLTQLGKVSLYASEVMENLYREAARVGDRSARLRSRVDAFEQELPSIEGKLASSTIKKMSQQPIAKFAAREQREANFFVASTMSVAIHGARAEAKPVPPLGNLDPFSGDSGSCLEKYTDPKFFMKEWVRIEAVKMEEAAAERKARKKARGKNKKGKKAGPRRAKVQAATLNKKIYSDRGAEFAPAQRQETKKIKNTQTSIDRSVSRSGTATDDSDPIYSGMAMERPSMDGGQSGPPAAPPPPPLMDVSPMAPPPPGGGFAAPPPPPIPPMAGAPPAPPVPFAPPIPAAPGIPAAYSAPPAPPLSGFGAPPAPPVPVAPQLAGPPAAPPLAGAPAAPPVPAGFGAVRAPSAAGSLLSQIQAGKSLRKTQEAPPRQATARGGLMDAIKSRQFNLKKVQVEEKKPEATAGGGMAEIMQILARRQAIAESDDDDESDEDDEEWED